MVTTKLEINGIFIFSAPMGWGGALCIFALLDHVLSCHPPILSAYEQCVQTMFIQAHTMFEQNFIWDFKGNE